MKRKFLPSLGNFYPLPWYSGGGLGWGSCTNGFSIACSIGLCFIFISGICQRCPAQSFPSTQPAPPTSRQAAPMSEDELPDDVLHGDIYAVAVLDFAVADKTAWSNAATVIMGGAPTTRPLAPNAQLPMGLEQALGPILRTGADRLVMGVLVKNNDAQIALHFPPDADQTAGRNWLSNVGTHGRIEREGQWLLVMSPNGRNAPVNPQADMVRAALNCWTDDAGLKIVYFPSEAYNRSVASAGPPAPIQRMIELFEKCQYLFVGGRLGAHPQLEIRWAAQDEGGADAVIKQFQTSRDEIKREGPSMGIPAIFSPVLALINPVREGNIVRVSLDQMHLATMFTTVVIAAAASRNQTSGGVEQVTLTPVAPDWTATDPATDSATAQMRLILVAIAEYDREHQALPNSLDDLVTGRLVPGPEFFHDPRTGQDNGFVYVKPAGASRLSDISNPAAPILYEIKNGQPDHTGLVGYANGVVGMGK
jgi:hypothetical protein